MHISVNCIRLLFKQSLLREFIIIAIEFSTSNSTFNKLTTEMEKMEGEKERNKGEQSKYYKLASTYSIIFSVTKVAILTTYCVIILKPRKPRYMLVGCKFPINPSNLKFFVFGELGERW